jgi:ABC-type glutathione transport system ATPase component
MEAEHVKTGSKSVPLLLVRGLSKSYLQRHWFSRQRFLIKAFDAVDLTIQPSSTLALVGESGAGKSTLARCIARMEEPSSGEIWYEGKNLLRSSKQEMLWAREKIQLIFQDATSALNPRLSAVEIIAEPLAIQGRGTKKERHRRALDGMERVGLSPEWGSRSPLEFSGGQRQRLALARALVLEPRLLILDEGLAGLDLSIQAQMVNLLMDLQASHALAYLYISHDLALVSRIADEVVVMREGRIVEHRRTRELFTDPRHSYTQALIAAIPRLESNP